MKEIKVSYSEYLDKYLYFDKVKDSYNPDEQTVILNLNSYQLEAFELMNQYNFTIHDCSEITATIKVCGEYDIAKIKSRIEYYIEFITEPCDNVNINDIQNAKENIIMFMHILEKKLTEQKKKECKDAFKGVTYIEVLQEAFQDMDLRLVQKGQYGIMLASTYKNQELQLCTNDERLYLDCILNYRKAVDFMEENAEEYINIKELDEVYEYNSVEHYMQILKITDGMDEVAKL